MELKAQKIPYLRRQYSALKERTTLSSNSVQIPLHCHQQYLSYLLGQKGISLSCKLVFKTNFYGKKDSDRDRHTEISHLLVLSPAVLVAGWAVLRLEPYARLFILSSCLVGTVMAYLEILHWQEDEGSSCIRGFK